MCGVNQTATDAWCTKEVKGLSTEALYRVSSTIESMLMAKNCGYGIVANERFIGIVRSEIVKRNKKSARAVKEL